MLDVKTVELSRAFDTAHATANRQDTDGYASVRIACTAVERAVGPGVYAAAACRATAVVEKMIAARANESVFVNAAQGGAIDDNQQALLDQVTVAFALAPSKQHEALAYFVHTGRLGKVEEALRDVALLLWEVSRLTPKTTDEALHRAEKYDKAFAAYFEVDEDDLDTARGRNLSENLYCAYVQAIPPGLWMIRSCCARSPFCGIETPACVAENLVADPGQRQLIRVLAADNRNLAAADLLEAAFRVFAEPH